MSALAQDWRDHPASAKEMFRIFPIMQQIYEMLHYLHEALNLEETRSIHHDVKRVLEETERLTQLSPQEIINLDVPSHRAIVSDLLQQTSEFVRAKVKKEKDQGKHSKITRGSQLIGANLRGANLKGTSFRGALLLAADLREADLGMSDFLGADMRDADLRGANLAGSIFLTQAQINSANGDRKTKLPLSLHMPQHWL
jgi:Pentapeptide repeats (9 copies)